MFMEVPKLKLSQMLINLTSSFHFLRVFRDLPKNKFKKTIKLNLDIQDSMFLLYLVIVLWLWILGVQIVVDKVLNHI